MHNSTKQTTHNVTLNPATLKTITIGNVGSMAEGWIFPIVSAVECNITMLGFHMLGKSQTMIGTEYTTYIYIYSTPIVAYYNAY